MWLLCRQKYLTSYYKEAAHFQMTGLENCYFINTHLVLLKLLCTSVHIKKKGSYSSPYFIGYGNTSHEFSGERIFIMLSIMAWKSPLSYSISIRVSIIPTFVWPLLPKIYVDSLFKFLPKLGHKMTDLKLGVQ